MPDSQRGAYRPRLLKALLRACLAFADGRASRYFFATRADPLMGHVRAGRPADSTGDWR